MAQDQVQGISIRPEDMVEGGAVPAEKNLLIESARFALYDYNGKAPPTVAAKLDLVDDEGTQYTQYYSAGDPLRFGPSPDGKTLVALGAAQNISKSSNFYTLMTNLVNAGYPENKLGSDISTLDGLYAFWTAVPQQKRAGLKKDEGAEAPKFEKVVLVPSQILRMPGEKAGKAVPAKKGAAPASVAPVEAGNEGTEGGDAVTAGALALVARAVGDSGSTTRQDLGVAVFKELATDPNRDAIAAMVYAPEFQAVLLANGYTIEGETFSK